MGKLSHKVVIEAEADSALTEVCGISLLERALRILQRLGVGRATIISASPEAIRRHLAQPSWARAALGVEVIELSAPVVTRAEIPETGDSLLLLDAGIYLEARPIEALLSREAATLLVDSAPPLIGRARRIAAGYLCGAAVLDAKWLKDCDAHQPLMEQLAHAADQRQISCIDVATLPTYLPNLRRHIRPLWFPAPGRDEIRAAECLLLRAAQNGTLDLPALVHAPIETWIVARLCKTRITPLHITLFTGAISLMATACFATGHLIAGVSIAVVVGILDGLDGKQARVKVETTDLGKREHVLDYALELSWWAALAFHFTSIRAVPAAYGLLLLLGGSDLVDRYAKRLVKQQTGRNLDDVAPIDRLVRLIGGRRNIYIWMLAAGLTLGRAAEAFVLICYWGAATAGIHILRALFLRRALPSSHVP